MRNWLLGSTTALAIALVACGGGSSAATDESNVSQELGFEYTCTASGAFILHEASSMKVAVSGSHLRFADGYGINFGARDHSYRPPQGTERARYDGFEYGGDCALRLVIDEGALSGAPTAKLRVQCSGDDFLQDVYSCRDPQRVGLGAPPPPPSPPAEPAGPPASAASWSCTTSDDRILSREVTMQVDADGMRLVADDLEYVGVRDPRYRSRSGSYIEFDDFGYGGDCSMSAVVEEEVLQSAAASEVTLKVRCAGDDFTQDTYRCVQR